MPLIHAKLRGPVVASLVCLSLAAQPQQSGLSEQEIDAAIALGKSSTKLEPYRLSGFFVNNKGYVLTPFLRVAIAARAAAKKYETFSRTNVSPELLNPLIDVVVPAYDLSDTNKNVSPVERFVNVETVLIMPKDSKDPAVALRPSQTLDDVSVLQNAFGMKIETKGVIAQFPRSAFKEGNEIVIVYEHRLGGGKQEFRGEFKEKDLAKWR